MLFKDYYEQVWLPLKEKQVKKTTLAGYKNYFGKHLLPEFGDSNLFEIRPFDVQAYFDAKSELSRKTLREHYNVLCAFFDYAIDDERVLLPPQSGAEQARRRALQRKGFESPPGAALGGDPGDHRRHRHTAAHAAPAHWRCCCLPACGAAKCWRCAGRISTSKGSASSCAGTPPTPTIRRRSHRPRRRTATARLPLYEQLSALLLPHKKGGYIVGGMQKPISMTVYRTMFNHVRKAIDLHDATAHVFRHSYLTMAGRSGRGSQDAAVHRRARQFLLHHEPLRSWKRARGHAGRREIRGIAQSGGADPAVRAGWRIAGGGRVTSHKFAQT